MASKGCEYSFLKPIPELSARLLPANFSSAFARKPWKPYRLPGAFGLRL